MSREGSSLCCVNHADENVVFTVFHPTDDASPKKSTAAKAALEVDEPADEKPKKRAGRPPASEKPQKDKASPAGGKPKLKTARQGVDESSADDVGVKQESDDTDANAAVENSDDTADGSRKRRRAAAEGVRKVRQVVSATEKDEDEEDDEGVDDADVKAETKQAKRTLREADDDEDQDYGDEGEDTASENDVEDDYKPKKGGKAESSEPPKKRGRPKGSPSNTKKETKQKATSTPAKVAVDKNAGQANSAHKSSGVGPLTSGNRRSAAAAVAAGVSGDDESPSPRKRGRPPKNPRVFSADGVDDPYAFEMPQVRCQILL